MGLNLGSDRSDVNETSYLQAKITVSDSAIEAKVGASALEGRQTLVIKNEGNFPVYRGKDNTVTVSTGTPLAARSTVVINTSLSVFLICSQANDSVYIEEYS